MKFLIFISLLVASFGTFAQNPQSQMSMGGGKNALEGFYFGLEYANLTDVNAKTSFKYFDGEEETITTKGGTHLGIAGLGVGYRLQNLKGNPISLTGGLKVLQTFNKSEYGEEKVTFWVPQVLIGYLPTQSFEIFLGASVPVLRGSEFMNQYKTRGGLSAGLAMNPTSSMTIKAAYDVYMQQLEQSDLFGSQMKNEVTLSGLALSTHFIF